MALAAGELLTTDTETITRYVELPDNKGGLDVILNVTGPVDSSFETSTFAVLITRQPPHSH